MLEYILIRYLKVAYWSALSVGYLWGTFSQIHYNYVALPKFNALENKRREKVVSEMIEKKNVQIAELQARLDKYEPAPAGTAPI